MDGYTKAAIKQALAKRSPRQVKFDDFMERVVNGPAVYGVAVLFYGFWGWVIWESLFGS
jgi:hypothetical protein